MPPPLISVIVVCRNPGPRLHAALASIWSQTGADAEAVVVDACSDDGTPAWLQSQSSRLGAWISEADGGVYDAMNKGLRLARGTWLLFLGADDVLAAPDTLAQVTPVLHTTPAAAVAGAARYDDGRHYAPAPDTQAIRRNFLHHQAAFYRRSTLSSTGGYDATLRYQADYDLNLRLLRTAGGVHRIDTLISLCARGGLSDAGHWANYREEIQVRHRHFAAWRGLPWDVAAAARWIRKFIRRLR